MPPVRAVERRRRNGPSERRTALRRHSTRTASICPGWPGPPPASARAAKRRLRVAKPDPGRRSPSWQGSLDFRSSTGSGAPSGSASWSSGLVACGDGQARACRYRERPDPPEPRLDNRRHQTAEIATASTADAVGQRCLRNTVASWTRYVLAPSRLGSRSPPAPSAPPEPRLRPRLAAQRRRQRQARRPSAERPASLKASESGARPALRVKGHAAAAARSSCWRPRTTLAHPRAVVRPALGTPHVGRAAGADPTRGRPRPTDALHAARPEGGREGRNHHLDCGRPGHVIVIDKQAEVDNGTHQPKVVIDGGELVDLQLVRGSTGGSSTRTSGRPAARVSTTSRFDDEGDFRKPAVRNLTFTQATSHRVTEED